MKAIVATLAAAGFAAVFSMPAQAEGTVRTQGASNPAAQVQHTQVQHTDVSSQRRHYRRHYGYRYRPYYSGPRYGYYRPYRYARPYPYYYRPGVSLGFWGGPRFGVWF